MVIGLIDEHGSRIFSGGTLDNGSEGKVDGDTIFEIGSVTKVFTSLLLVDAVNRGEVELDDPLKKYLPNHVKVPTFNDKEITLLNLAVQDSGLPWHAHEFKKNDRALTRKELRDAANAFTVNDLYQSLSQTKLTEAPGTRFQYSNVGMALLGNALEFKTGSKYESLVLERICKQLEMDSTLVNLKPSQKTRLALGHWADGRLAENMKMQVMQPAGSLKSTGNDLLNFLGANLGFSESPLVPLMRQTQEIRHTNQVRFGDTAMPWFNEGIFIPPNCEILGHGGGGFGYLAFIGIEKQKRRGVVVLSSHLGVSPYGIGWSLLQGVPLTQENIKYWVREVVGLGFALKTHTETGLPQIETVWPNSSAGKADLETGDLIKKINGTSVEGKSLRDCLSMMAGPNGAKVQLELVDQNQKVKAVELKRKKFLTVTGDYKFDD